ncbi:hypothetical protein M0R45_030399 [Rubus argutus]|uniref:MHC class I antigen n=1 Tax=Rubus argutus TaxID=59490 RepID=A0AAW1WDF3_RUBAR
MATVHGQTARAARHRGLWLISGVARDEVHGQSTWAFQQPCRGGKAARWSRGDAYLHGVDGDELAAFGIGQ